MQEETVFNSWHWRFGRCTRSHSRISSLTISFFLYRCVCFLNNVCRTAGSALAHAMGCFGHQDLEFWQTVPSFGSAWDQAQRGIIRQLDSTAFQRLLLCLRWSSRPWVRIHFKKLFAELWTWISTEIKKKSYISGPTRLQDFFLSPKKHILHYVNFFWKVFHSVYARDSALLHAIYSSASKINPLFRMAKFWLDRAQLRCPLSFNTIRSWKIQGNPPSRCTSFPSTHFYRYRT